MMTSFHSIFVFLSSCALGSVLSLEVFQQRVVVNSSELCIIPINPTHLRWEKQPDLPEWLKYTYDGYTSTGYIYGVPPMRLVTLNLDVIGFNRYDNYDVKQLIISLEIMRREPMEYIIEMKIDNMNIRDLCIPRRMNDLRNVLAENLGWKKKDGNRVVPVYMASAVDVGENRVPLRPNEAEGVVIHFASDKDFSPALRKLQVEISPLSKLRPCPRDMKRTSVERHFRRYSFLVDWCSFRLVTTVVPPSGSEEQGKKGSQKNTAAIGSDAEGVLMKPSTLSVGKAKIPERTYGYETLLATILPGSIGGLIGIVLLALLWADREDESVYNDGNNGANYGYHQINRQQQEEAMLLSRDVVMKPDPVMEPTTSLVEMDRELIGTPLPPQYSETHPNGAPALIYAV
ncbi:Epsilon-sarcoglycan [Orchesella cincta]|uniref:Epsilon-sarcoglycan n=1 Tax=Orchesella cincta TaxID=48709 RepID=A0A1D2N021_ORCCI|nr:Epsilon-sarcoglycan [Orchesella cincta]